MRLIDSQQGHLFMLPPANVILLAPKRSAGGSPVLLHFDAPAPAPRSRSLVVHGNDGAQQTCTFVETPRGWRRQQ